MKNISKLNNNDEEGNTIRSLGHNALVELLNNNNKEIENELHDNENGVNEINLFEISNCIENESNDKKKKEMRCSSTKLLNKFSYNKLNENKIDTLYYDNNFNVIKTECIRHNYFNAIDKNNIFLSDKGQKIFMNDNIKKNMNNNLLKINSMNRNIAYDDDLYNILKKKRKVKSEMLENITAPKNDIRNEKKKKDFIYFNIEDTESEKKITAENCNNINKTKQNYNEISEKKEDIIADNKVKNNNKKSTPKTKNNKAILCDIEKTTLEINDLYKTQEKLSEGKNKKDNENNIEMDEYYDICSNKDNICNNKINNNSSKKREHKNSSMNTNIINENKDKKKNINNRQHITKKKEVLKLDDDHIKKNENNLRFNEEKSDMDKCIIKKEECNSITGNEHLVKNENIDENVLKDGMKESVNSESFIFLDFNPLEEDYLEIKNALKNYKKNYISLYTKENIDHNSNSKNGLKETYIKKEKENTHNLEQINSSTSFYIKRKYNDLKETLLKKKINIINYDFKNNICYVLIKKSSTL
ncbi:conserved Plasmodium protein, unknown function [Plasmodium relictum]|uniref:Uncharacterized protein n=1 Tax=Plasmodium relictum TaxID=85471 RepID=A0A1J1H9Q1_PLARL|nr:conserved Plasmodium protein, unknown function [Plasmodium relictum]CRH00319.1 conserved Plasmodium protein, unknown function [Plasmodium relictum]